MKIFYEAIVKLKIIIESDKENIPVAHIPTKEILDNSILELINNELGEDATCEISIDSKYGLT